MMKQILLLAVIFTIGIFSSSCTSLKSKYYVGDKQPISEKELSTDSVWQVGDDVFSVRIVNTNTLIASSIKWDEKSNKHTIESHPLVFSKLGENTFLNVKDGDLYTILRLIQSGEDSVVLLTVDSKKIENDIAEGKIKAHKNGQDIITDCTKEELDKYIQENIQTLFSLDAASVAKLLSGEME